MLAVVVLWFARGSILPALGHWLDVGEKPRAADCVLVLPGDSSTRPFVAAALVRAGLADRVLIPQVDREPAQQDGIAPAEDELIRRVLIHRGVEEDRLKVLPGRSISTVTDARMLLEYLDGHPERRVCVVTNHYHTRRTRWTFRRVLGEEAAKAFFVSAPTDGFTLERWWHSESGFLLVTSEYAKLAFYWARYMPWPWMLLGAGAVVVVLLAMRRKREGVRAA